MPFFETIGGTYMKYKAIDLFCGAGGMSEGITQAGFHIVYSNDINKQVEQTYTNRHEQLGLVHGENTFFQCEDIRNVNWQEMKKNLQSLPFFQNQQEILIDVLFGGPPCQGFSRAGKRMKNDPRNFLFREYLRLIHEIQPKYVVMENVVGLLDTRLDGFKGVFGDTYPDDSLITDLLASEFEKIGYGHLEPRVLDASDYGVPQKRRRVIYLAYRKDMPKPRYPQPTTPLPEQKVTVHQAISDLIIQDEYRHHHTTLSPYQKERKNGKTVNRFVDTPLNQELSKHDKYIVERFKLFQHGETQKEIRDRLKKGFDPSPILLEKIKHDCKNDWSDEQWLDICRNSPTDDMINSVLTKKNTRKRLAPNECSPTMMSAGDDFIHPYEPRALNVREMARLQSFDDSFVFLGKRTTGGMLRRVDVPQYTQVGNAVPPLLAYAIASEMIQLLDECTSDLS